MNTKYRSKCMISGILTLALTAQIVVAGRQQNPVPAGPKIMSWGPAVYPPSAVPARERGRVRLRLVVSPDGKVGEAVVTSSRGPLLDSAAIETLKQWVFLAPLRDGKPVETHPEFEVNFVPPSDNSITGLTSVQVFGNVNTDDTPFGLGVCRGPNLTEHFDTAEMILKEAILTDLPTDEKELLAYLQKLANGRGLVQGPCQGDLILH